MGFIYTIQIKGEVLKIPKKRKLNLIKYSKDLTNKIKILNNFILLNNSILNFNFLFSWLLGLQSAGNIFINNSLAKVLIINNIIL